MRTVRDHRRTRLHRPRRPTRCAGSTPRWSSRAPSPSSGAARRVGKTRLLIEWSQRHDGLYAAADPSAPAVQRRYLAAAVERRFPGFADVEYPDWRSFLQRLAREADGSGWRGPFVLDELPYLIAADSTLPGVLQAWVDSVPGRPNPGGQRVEPADDARRRPLCRRAALRPGAGSVRRAPAEAGIPGRPVPRGRGRDLLALYALWGGMPRYWELAEPFGLDLESAVDTLVLDPAGPLHLEPDRLLLEEVPPATALRPLLDVIGAGAHRVSEIGGSPRLARLQSVAAAGGTDRDGTGAPGDAVRERSPLRQAEPVSDRRPVPAVVVPGGRAGAGRPSRRRRARRGWRTGAGTAPGSKRRPGRSSAAWRCRSCTAPSPPSPTSVPGSRRNATGGATSRSTTSWRARSTAGACSSARRSRHRGRCRRRRCGSVRVRHGDSRRWQPGDRAGGVHAAGDNRAGRRARRARGRRADGLRVCCGEYREPMPAGLRQSRWYRLVRMRRQGEVRRRRVCCRSCPAALRAGLRPWPSAETDRPLHRGRCRSRRGLR